MNSLKDNQYLHAAALGLFTFISFRLILMLADSAISGWTIPIPSLLALVPAVWAAYWYARRTPN